MPAGPLKPHSVLMKRLDSKKFSSSSTPSSFSSAGDPSAWAVIAAEAEAADSIPPHAFAVDMHPGEDLEGSLEGLLLTINGCADTADTSTMLARTFTPSLGHQADGAAIMPFAGAVSVCQQFAIPRLPLRCASGLGRP